MDVPALRAALLTWYDAQARTLPWRAPPGADHRTDPYRVWLSEVMLQQTTTPHAAALVMPAAPPSASGASEHTRTWTHPDLEHGFGTRRRIRDPRILCNRAFDVRQSGEWAFAQAFFVIHFFGRKTEYAGTPLTLTKPTARRRTDIHENSNSASFIEVTYSLFMHSYPPI